MPPKVCSLAYIFVKSGVHFVFFEVYTCRHDIIGNICCYFKLNIHDVFIAITSSTQGIIRKFYIGKSMKFNLDAIKLVGFDNISAPVSSIGSGSV
jgi:hypothetical protein